MIESRNQFSDKIEFTNKKAWLIVDIVGNIKYSNQTFTEIFHLNKDDNLNKLKILPDFHSITVKLSESEITEFSNSFIYETEEQIFNFQIEIEKVILFNSPYFVIVFNAQEEEKYIEDKISNLHFALEYGKIPVIIFDNRGIISFVTNSFEKIFSCELDKIYNSHISSLFLPYLKPNQLENLISSIESGEQWNETISLSFNKEQPLYFELKLNPIHNDEGKTLNFVLTVHDISSYILKNETIKKSEKRLKSIINNISDLLIILKQSNNFICFENANDNFLKIFNIDKDYCYHKNYEDFLPKSLTSEIEEAISKLKVELGGVYEFEFKASDSHYSGKITSIEKTNGSELLYIVSLKDITNEKKKKKQLKELYKKEMQLNRLKTTFLQNMSHEIRTPFTEIMGYSDIMVESIEEEDYETVIEITDSLKHVLNRVVNLFENIIEVSEIEAGEVNLETVSINCNQILNAVYNKKLEDAKKRGLEFELDLDEEEYLCLVDWVKFEKIILNLVENAIKYTDKGNIKISSKKMEDHIIIKIADTGLGINEKIIFQLLEPFVQEELDGHSRNYEGAGLGLTIACEYTKLMNGEMSIKSEKKIGTEINLTFPIEIK
ncbi:MAG: PAS domain-containing sensor histidine kinase [Melioribacteraceae bacterium]|nr:PAS domain-containing sensor histidine kinase [Melioribacteraceae bacterium]